ncbi:MAG: protease [Bacillota bacterium]|nr:protease [Bacillota bacterium]
MWPFRRAENNSGKLIPDPVGVVLVLGVLASLVVGLATAPRAGRPAARAVGSRAVGLIYVDGVITGGESAAGFFGASTGSDSVLAQLKEAREDPGVKAVVLRINSPGGSAPAAQEIGDEIERLRKAGKLVVASMGDVAASGGYWIAAMSDRIIAEPATLTGSIGVIMQLTNMQNFYGKIGFSYETFKSGPHKDMGSSVRPVSPEERAIFQSMIDDIYGQFINVVAQGRNMPVERVRAIADGRVFTGRQAKTAGLVDELGNFNYALDRAATLAGLGKDYEVREFGKLTPIERLLNQLAGAASLRLPFAAGSVPAAPGPAGLYLLFVPPAMQ